MKAVSINTLSKPAYKKIAQHFSRVAEQYESLAQLQQRIGTELLQQVNPVENVLDLACGTAFLTPELKKKCSETLLVSLDISEAMLQQAALKKAGTLLCANMENLPFATHSFDLVFSNMSLQWSSNLLDNFQEIHRVLKKNGTLLFSIPGPSTLVELKRSWQQVDQHAHVNEFCSQLLLQQKLSSAGFKNIKLLTKHYTLEYASVLELMQHLKGIGADCVTLRTNTLTGKHKFAHMLKAYEVYRQPNNLLPCTYEIIFIEAS